MRYSNPPNKKYVRDISIIGIFAFALGIIGILLGLGPFNGMVIAIVMGIFGFLFIFIAWYRENIHRPSSVDINDNGVIMEFRSSRRVICPWSEIAGVFSDPPDQPGAFKGGAGAIILWKSNLPYFTTYEISIAILTKFREIQHFEMPQKLMNETERDFKRRLRKEKTTSKSKIEE
jgi:hypothetical protein